MQRTIPFGAPMIGAEERAAVADVLAGPILVHGPRAIKFEEDFAAFVGAPHGVSVSSSFSGAGTSLFPAQRYVAP